MARLLQQIIEPPHPCAYLANTTASLDVRVLLDVTPLEFEAMLMRGWRRFGPMYFRPVCAPCMGCVSIRLAVDRFRPNQSQRRAARNTLGLRIQIGPPRVDTARLDLYHRWHGFREQARGWPAAALTPGAYRTEFAFQHPCVREITYWDDAAGGKLVGVGICDETPSAWSAVYFFYDPAYARASLGTLNVMTQVRVARALKIPHVYLGYWVDGSESMRYKSTYTPHELLVGRPSMDEEPMWREATELVSQHVTQHPESIGK